MEESVRDAAKAKLREVVLGNKTIEEISKETGFSISVLSDWYDKFYQKIDAHFMAVRDKAELNATY